MLLLGLFQVAGFHLKLEALQPGFQSFGESQQEQEVSPMLPVWLEGSNLFRFGIACPLPITQEVEFDVGCGRTN